MYLLQRILDKHIKYTYNHIHPSLKQDFKLQEKIMPQLSNIL